MKVAAYIVSGLLGLASSFQIFAIAFNGGSFKALILPGLLILAVSGIAGWFTDWKKICGAFYAGHAPLFGLFTMGAIEKAGWALVMPVIALISALIWLPAALVSFLTKRKAKTPSEGG